jgi:hypothetical protein
MAGFQSFTQKTNTTIAITKQGTASWNSSEGIDDKQTTIANVKFTAVKK